jgi:hypothetical protein
MDLSIPSEAGQVLILTCFRERSDFLTVETEEIQNFFSFGERKEK